MELTLRSLSLTGLTVVLAFSHTFGQNKYQAPRAKTAPVIDGAGTDACWSSAPWYEVNQLWFGVQPSSPADFSERFKVCWDANKLYVLAEVTDDVLNDNYTDPLSNYWEDDTWEVFIDEDNSGGNHEKSYNAFAYHVSKSLDAVDIGSDGVAHLYNTHLTIKRSTDGNNKYTWEAAFEIYNDKFVYGATSNPKVTLTKNKVMGFALAYCDNDGGTARQSFIGSEPIAGTDKNVAYKDANVFGDLELVDVITASFSHVSVASSLSNPTAMTIAPDGRFFICEQEGRLRVVKQGQLLATPAVSLNVNLGNEFYSERGLLGVAVDPDFANNNNIYLFYTTSPNGKYVAEGAHNRVSRFTLNGDVVVAGSEKILLELDPLSSAINHNGGTLRFGKDKKLYIATGENFTQANAQNLKNTHGKLLRLNVDGTIPADNPLKDSTLKQTKMIWAYGLRNPFTFDVQPGTGRMFINDVGQDTWEEINESTIGGQNFGWPLTEGKNTEPGITSPLLTYKHSETPTDTTGCAISCGTFFNPDSSNYPSRYIGKYFYADFCNNWIAVMDPASNKRVELFATKVSDGPVGLGVHNDGNLYYLSRTSGALYKISYTGSPLPEILVAPTNQSVAESQPALLKVQANGASPLYFQWLKNGDTISGAIGSTYRIPITTKADSGLYSVIISNEYDTIKSGQVKLTITAFNSKPIATITSPKDSSFYTGGQAFVITGSGNDPQDGELPASNFTWKVDFHHDTHVHDGIPTIGNKTLALTIPSDGETASDVWYRIHLYVKDKGGLTDTAYIDLIPKKAVLTFATQPAGLVVTIDGQPTKTPVSIQSVVGIKRNIGVPTPQTLNNKGWKYKEWSNAGTQTQTFATPANNTTFTAVFDEAPITRETLAPSNDAYVTNATSFAPDGPITPYGFTDSLQLVVKRYAEGPNREVYFTFDLNKLMGKLPQIKSATLKFSASMTDENGTVKTVGYGVYESKSTDWNEKTITWTNKPNRDTVAIVSGTIPNLALTSYQVDLTAFIKAKAVTVSKMASFVFAAKTDNKNRVLIYSKENLDNKPELIIDYDATTKVEEETELVGSISLFPNPTSKLLTISLQNMSLADGVLQLMDQTGTTLKTQKVQLVNAYQSLEWNIEHLKSGLYFVSIQSGDKRWTEKLVVE